MRARADPRPDDLHRLGRAPRPGTSSWAPGVLSLPYHNPLWVADRALFLDRLLRGRFMLGLGPGALPDRRDDDRHHASRSSGRRSRRTSTSSWRSCAASRSRPRPTATTSSTRGPSSRPTATSTSSSQRSPRPTGPRAAAKNGAGLMSVGATAKGGFDALALHWDVMEERAPQFGHTPDRSKWRLAGPMHLAETTRAGDRGRALRPRRLVRLHPERARRAALPGRRQDLRGARRVGQRDRPRRDRHRRTTRSRRSSGSRSSPAASAPTCSSTTSGLGTRRR